MLVSEMAKLNVPLIATSQGIDTSSDSPIGSLQLHIIMAFSNFERELIRERVICGLRAAKNRGQKFGRPSTLHKHRDEVLALRGTGMKLREISRELNIPISSVCKITKVQNN
jgi:DNA invertase Pin-like site-specific DNA recombinase